MIQIKQERIKETPTKRQDALANSSYLIIRNRKETKTSLERSKRDLLTKR